MPPLSTLRGYRGRDLRRDAVAGLAVWAAAVPSGLAYAGLAGLPPIVGLYASAVAGLAYGIAGSIRQAQVGPTSTSSILTAAAIAPMADGDVARATGLAAILAIEVAAFLLLAWALRLGFLADRLVDRLGRDPHRVIIREVQAQPVGDLLRAPRPRPAPIPSATAAPADPRDLRTGEGDAVGTLHAASQPLLYVTAQPIVNRQLRRLGALRARIGMPLRCRRPVVQAAAARRGVAPQLARDRRR
jgi:hypothetical protein